MSLDSAAIFAAVQAHAMTLGIFDRVGAHEPKNAPGNGLTCAIWDGGIRAIPAASGLASASALLTFTVRIYNPMLQQPQDGIDPKVLTAADALFSAYAGGFTLGGLIRNVDIFGAYGAPLATKPGYLNQDGKIFRISEITLPMVISDLWDEAA